VASKTPAFEKLPRCSLVLIEWEDSTQPHGPWQWLSAVRVPKVVRCVSVGFLIQSTEKVKTLAPNLGNIDLDEDVQASGLISIPTKAVLRITLIRETTSPSVYRTNCGALSLAALKHPAVETRPKRPVRESRARSNRHGV
jgi:hypothetical protein